MKTPIRNRCRTPNPKIFVLSISIFLRFWNYFGVLALLMKNVGSKVSPYSLDQESADLNRTKMKKFKTGSDQDQKIKSYLGPGQQILKLSLTLSKLIYFEQKEQFSCKSRIFDHRYYDLVLRWPMTTDKQDLFDRQPGNTWTESRECMLHIYILSLVENVKNMQIG